MTAPAYIWQIVLNQGGGTRSLRDDASEPALVVSRPLLDMTTPQVVEDLGIVQAEIGRGRALVLISDETGPLAAIGVADRSIASAGLWRRLHEIVPRATLVTDPAAPPAAPWCGLVLADRMRERPRTEVTHMIVLARVLGWAWMERDA